MVEACEVVDDEIFDVRVFALEKKMFRRDVREQRHRRRMARLRREVREHPGGGGLCDYSEAFPCAEPVFIERESELQKARAEGCRRIMYPRVAFAAVPSGKIPVRAGGKEQGWQGCNFGLLQRSL